MVMMNPNETSSDSQLPSTPSTTLPESRPLRVQTLSKSPQLARLEAERSASSKLPVKAQKQRINQLKNELELVLRELAAPAVGEVLQKAIMMALAGDKSMIRLILELHMSKPQAQEDATGGKSQVNIQINNLTNKKKPPVEVIDVQAETAGDDRHAEGDPQDDSAGS